ncbi:GATA transcription factor [Parasponia andersonii]|uniref:GATA transcription factor n=1 Tax=Parasponia andersonii TaxID=3476 RepID=A0A2P5BGS0_PARAD|nr:GATA transcription factor [Parasponia andersonii]
MECMEAKALRPSLRTELTQQEFLEEFYTAGAGVSCVPGDDFSVDELLNLQNGEFEDGSLLEEGEKDSLFVEDESFNVSGGYFGAGDSESVLTSELAVPDDDLAELEWVSHFVDDSLSEISLSHVPIGKQRTGVCTQNRCEPEARRTGTGPTCFPSVPVRTRTKRARPTTRTWPRSNSLSPRTESESSSSSSFSSSPSLTFTNTAQTVEFLQNLGEPASKKQKKKPVQTGGGSAGVQFQRRCSHCQVQKTPQWRTGPLGAKTLCNACGVRFKSGRLFPEYRPACSPTFCSDTHSNSHRKVLEMRKKKDPGSRLTHAISSF